MNEKNGIGESKSKQSQRQGESAPEMPVGRAYGVGPLAVGKVLNSLKTIDEEIKGVVTSAMTISIENRWLCRGTEMRRMIGKDATNSKQAATIRYWRITDMNNYSG